MCWERMQSALILDSETMPRSELEKAEELARSFDINCLVSEVFNN